MDTHRALRAARRSRVREAARRRSATAASSRAPRACGSGTSRAAGISTCWPASAASTSATTTRGCVARLHAFLDERPLNLSHTGPSPLRRAARRGARRAPPAPPLEMSLFSTSGAEAVEAAIKLARAATGRTRDRLLRGRLSRPQPRHAVASARSQRMREPFEPLLPGCTAVPFGDVDALARALARRRRGGVPRRAGADRGRRALRAAGLPRARRASCARRHGTLLVLDEVQTGFGRTGSLFAFQQEDVDARRADPRQVGRRLDRADRRDDDDAPRSRRRRTDRCAASTCTARRSPATRSRPPPRSRRCASSRTSGSSTRSRDAGAAHARRAARRGCAAIRSCAEHPRPRPAHRHRAARAARADGRRRSPASGWRSRCSSAASSCSRPRRPGTSSGSSRR